MNNIFNLSLAKPKFEDIEKKTSNALYYGNRSVGRVYIYILGAKQFGNITFYLLLTFGGLGFLLAGLLTYITTPEYIQEISYLPQGILLTFYGTLAICLGLYLDLTIFLDIGSGFNEINKIDKVIRIQRITYPTKKILEVFRDYFYKEPRLRSYLLLTYEMRDIKKLKIKITEGLNPRQTIYLCMKNEREIPLSFTDQLPSLTKTEQRATLLSNTLEVPLEIKTVKTI